MDGPDHVPPAWYLARSMKKDFEEAIHAPTFQAADAFWCDNRYVWTPLGVAIYLGLKDAVAFLIKKNAPLDSLCEWISIALGVFLCES